MNIKATFAIIATVAILAAAITPTFLTQASAKITAQTTDTGCTNPAGKSPGGQQPTCEGEGLTQETETTNVNPSGAAPPGQNK